VPVLTVPVLKTNHKQAHDWSELTRNRTFDSTEGLSYVHSSIWEIYARFQISRYLKYPNSRWAFRHRREEIGVLEPLSISFCNFCISFPVQTLLIKRSKQKATINISVPYARVFDLSRTFARRILEALPPGLQRDLHPVFSIRVLALDVLE
jgi:hypothetical protein